MKNQTFEIVELYPMYGIPKAKLILSAHVYLIDHDIDIRGFTVHVHSKEIKDDPKRTSKVYDPMAIAWDYDENKLVRFPIITMINDEIMDSIKQELINEGKKKLKSFKFPKNFPKNFFEYKALFKPKTKPKEDDKPIKKNTFVSYQSLPKKKDSRYGR